jgi:hypothetical protein
MPSPWPASIHGLGPRRVAGFTICSFCPPPQEIPHPDCRFCGPRTRDPYKDQKLDQAPCICVPPCGTWARYGEQALCLEHAWVAADAFGEEP